MRGDWGNPYAGVGELPRGRPPGTTGRRSGRWLAPAAVGLAGVSTLWALTMAGDGVPLRDVQVEPLGLEVGWVLPGGQAWNTGLRQGQALVAFLNGDSPLLWRVEVTPAPDTILATGGPGQRQVLRQTVPVALAALLLCLAAVGLLPLRRELAVAAALAAAFVAAVPVAATNTPIASTALLAAIPLVGAAWLVVGAARYRFWPVVPAAAAAGAIAWTAARFAALPVYQVADAARVATTVAALVTAFAVAAPWRRWAADTATRNPPRALDVLAAVMIGAGTVTLVALAAVPVPMAVAAAMVAGAAYVLVRARLASIVEHLVTDGVRDRAALAATEEERARLAAEIHDGPVQVLAAAVAGLRDGGSADDAITLLEEAGLELRAVSAALRPPVLDDLGLDAALGWLVDQTRIRLDADVAIAGDITHTTGLTRHERPPADVELAAFRIAQEAVGNVISHASASRITVRADVRPDRLRLEIEDDGCGIRQDDLWAARRAGRLGMATMHQRATSVGAALAVGAASPTGTLVTLDWSRP